MCHRLSHGKRGLVQVQRAFEHDRDDLRRAARLFRAGLHDLRQPIAVVVMQLADPRVQPGERFAVGGQRQCGLGQGAKFVDGVKKLAQCVGFGLHLVDTDVGRNARQHHVAADQQPQCRTVERDMLRCMAVAADAQPLVGAYGQGVPVHQAAVLFGYGRYQTRKIGRPCLDLTYRAGVVEAMGSEKLCCRLATECGGPHRAQSRHVVVGRADPKPHVPALAQPVRQTDVVGVHVGHDDAQYRQALKLAVKNLLPLFPGLIARNAAVDDAPACASVLRVTQQPQVDVVQREWQ